MCSACALPPHPCKRTPFRSLPTAPTRHSLPTVPVLPVFATALNLAWPRTASEDIQIHRPRANQCKQSLITGSGSPSVTPGFFGVISSHSFFAVADLHCSSETDQAIHFPPCLSTFFCRPELRTSLTTFAQILKHASPTRGHRSHS